MVETSQILIRGGFLCWSRFGTRFSSKVSRLSVNLMCVCMSGFPWVVLFCVLKWSKMAVFWSDAWECVLKWSFYLEEICLEPRWLVKSLVCVADSIMYVPGLVWGQLTGNHVVHVCKHPSVNDHWFAVGFPLRFQISPQDLPSNVASWKIPSDFELGIPIERAGGIFQPRSPMIFPTVFSLYKKKHGKSPR